MSLKERDWPKRLLNIQKKKKRIKQKKGSFYHKKGPLVQTPNTTTPVADHGSSAAGFLLGVSLAVATDDTNVCPSHGACWLLNRHSDTSGENENLPIFSGLIEPTHQSAPDILPFAPPAFVEGACAPGGCWPLENVTCFSEGPQSFPWAALHSRAMSAYLSFSSSLRSLARLKGRQGERRREARAPRPAGRGLGIAGRRFQRRFARAGHKGLSPSSRSHGVTDLFGVSFPPPSPSHLPNCPPLAPPSALPPSQQSSRGWHPPREPRAGLAAAVRGSSPARRNSRHSGWACGSAWQAWSGFDPPETGPATAPSPGSRP